jgi:hypothetical protein
VRCILAGDLQFIEAIVQVGALTILIALVRCTLHRSFREYFLTALSRRMSIWTITRILTISSLICLLLDLGMELPELNLAAISLVLAL